jgi:hypothetical protein
MSPNDRINFLTWPVETRTSHTKHTLGAALHTVTEDLIYTDDPYWIIIATWDPERQQHVVLWESVETVSDGPDDWERFDLLRDLAQGSISMESLREVIDKAHDWAVYDQAADLVLKCTGGTVRPSTAGKWRAEYADETILGDDFADPELARTALLNAVRNHRDSLRRLLIDAPTPLSLAAATQWHGPRISTWADRRQRDHLQRISSRLDASMVATVLAVDVDTVNDWIQRGVLPAPDDDQCWDGRTIKAWMYHNKRRPSG